MIIAEHPSKKAPEAFSFDELRALLAKKDFGIPAGDTSSVSTVAEAIALENVNKYRGDWK